MTTKEMTKVLRMPSSTTQANMVQEFVGELLKEHPTHQASIVRNLQHILIAYGQSGRGGDMRNENAVKFAQEVSDIETTIPYI